MTIRKPLVIGTDGRIQQLQSSDTIQVATTQTDVIAKQNNEAGAIVIGTPVYANAATGVKKAQANAVSTSQVIGLVYDASITNGVSGQIATDGFLTATTTQWDAVAGTTGGLAFNTLYFLDPATPGKITATVPVTVGQCVVAIGTAMSTTDLDINIQEYVLL